MTGSSNGTPLGGHNLSTVVLRSGTKCDTMMSILVGLTNARNPV
jgi:hypothetical protein